MKKSHGRCLAKWHRTGFNPVRKGHGDAGWLTLAGFREVDLMRTGVIDGGVVAGTFVFDVLEQFLIDTARVRHTRVPDRPDLPGVEQRGKHGDMVPVGVADNKVVDGLKIRNDGVEKIQKPTA
jgi:hypothetical protein